MNSRTGQVSQQVTAEWSVLHDYQVGKQFSLNMQSVPLTSSCKVGVMRGWGRDGERLAASFLVL